MLIGRFLRGFLRVMISPDGPIALSFPEESNHHLNNVTARVPSCQLRTRAIRLLLFCLRRAPGTLNGVSMSIADIPNVQQIWADHKEREEGIEE